MWGVEPAHGVTAQREILAVGQHAGCTIGKVGNSEHSSIMIGKAPPELRTAWDMTIEAFDRICDAMRPGVTLRDLIAAGEVNGLNGRAKTSILLHGRGTWRRKTVGP